MNLTKCIVAAALAVVTTAGTLAATPVQAQTWVSVSYRDRDWRDGRRDGWDRRWRDDRRYRRDRDRDGIPDRYDRRPYHYDRHRYDRRCWTEWRYDRWHGRYPVRYCR